jgi:hypothetical protein
LDGIGEGRKGGRAVSKLLLMVASQEVNLLPRPKYLPESMNRVTRSIWSGAPAMPRITYTLIKHPVSSMAASVRSSRMPPSSGSDFGVRQLANPDRKNPDLARTPLPGAERVKYCYVGGSPVLLPLPPNIWEGWAIIKSLQALTLFACAFLERKAELMGGILA